MNSRCLAFVGWAVLILATVAAAEDGVRIERADLAAGFADIDGRIQGREAVDHKLALGPGTPLVIELKADNRFAFFNLLPPGSNDVAVFVGAREGDRYEGVTTEAGDWTVRVFLMRNAARRNEIAHYQLHIALGDAPGAYADGAAGGPDFWEVAGLSAGGALNLRAKPSTSSAIVLRLSNGAILRNLGCRMTEGRRWCEVALPDAPETRGYAAGQYLREGAPLPPGDAKVPGTPYHATGSVACGDRQCRFGVVRMGGGAASVTIEGPSGPRMIHFQSGEVLAIEGGLAFEARREGDEMIVTIEGGETYRIFDAVIFGG